MAYQNPAFMIEHPSDVIGTAEVTARNSLTFTTDSKRALLDRRQGELGSFTANGANGGFALDYGTTAASRTINRCVIPAGHNFDGETLEIISDNSGATLPSPTVEDSIAVSGSAVIDFPFADKSGERYWGLQVTTSASETFNIGEFALGDRVALSAGANPSDVQPDFDRAYLHDVATDVIGGRDIALELTPPRRSFSLEIRYVIPGSDDADILEEIIRLGVSTPFWYWTPDSTDTGPYLVKLSGSATRSQESQQPPQALIAYSVKLEMIEQTT